MLGGALIGAATLSVVGPLVRKGSATSDVWIVAAGSSGTLTRSDSDEWHSDFWWSEGALDIGAQAGAAVALYFRILDTAYYGRYECTHLEDSCEAWLYDDHKKIRFALGSSDFNQFADAGYIHVVPWSLTLGQIGSAYRQVAYVAGGSQSAGADCWTGPHLHQTANGTHMWEDPDVPQSASAGNTPYWYWNSP
ncbi:MAG: hypothetical protein ACR2HN_07315 [Tepidiformaceae bacterium]